MKTETITLQSDGSQMSAFVARPETTKAPALIVLQEAFGVNDHIKDVTKRFAEQGYLAVAPELFHRTAPPEWTAGYGNFEPIKPHLQAVTTEAITADVRAVYDWIEQDSQAITDKVGAIGYCMGGRAAFVANATLPLQAASSYYGGGTDQLLDLAPKQHAPMLFCWGGLDKHITADKRRVVIDAMNSAEKPYINTEFSFADHAFFCDARPNYNPIAAKQAWTLTLSFLETYLKG
jgi:carboxymethylenebutenolidase